jgi:hypothetical protein
MDFMGIPVSFQDPSTYEILMFLLQKAEKIVSMEPCDYGKNTGFHRLFV